MQRPAEPAPQPSRNVRYHALDALRAAAMALGVVLHATMAYMVVPLGSITWPARDPAAVPWPDAAFWWLHTFRIPLFFVISGFFSEMLIRSRGPAGFIAHRTERIAVPMLLAAVTILPLCFPSWMWGMVHHGDATWAHLWRLDFTTARANPDALHGSGHLWFLEYLFICGIIFFAIRRFISPPPEPGDDDAPSPARRQLFAPWAPIALALPTALLLLARPQIFLTFRNTWAAEPDRLLYYAYFFFVGVMMYRLRGELPRLIRPAGWQLIAGNAAFVAVYVLIFGGPTSHIDQINSFAARLGHAVGIALCCWLNLFGCLGLFLRFFDSHRPLVRYLSDASYWIYLAHLPVVVFMHVALMKLDAALGITTPALIKCATAVATALAATLVTYHYCVRYTWIGTLLNGPRHRPTTESEAVAPTPPS